MSNVLGTYIRYLVLVSINISGTPYILYTRTRYLARVHYYVLEGSAMVHTVPGSIGAVRGKASRFFRGDKSSPVKV